jgi:hypothetical protein
MSESNKDNQKNAQELLSRALTRQVRAAQQVYDLLARFGRGEITAQAMSEEYARFASQEAGHYASDLAELSIRYYSDLLAINQAYSERFIRALEGKSGVQDAGGPQAPARRVEMELRAPLGQEAVRAFVLENKRGGTAHISFEVSDFRGPAGVEPFQAGLQLQPDQFTLEPGQEQSVTIRVPLRAGLFEPGQRYEASVIVRGYDDLELALVVWVNETV